MYTECVRDGIVSADIGKKGVLTARRDNSPFIRAIYTEMMMMIFNKEPRDNILAYILDEINKLCCFYYNYKEFIVTKSVGSIGDGSVSVFINEKGKKKGLMGSYKVPLLSNDPVERQRQFKLKNTDNKNDYYLRCLPAQIQLAEKIRSRGQRVDTGSRLEYVITTQGGTKGKQYEKIEDATYFALHSDIFRVEYYAYLKTGSTALDFILNVMYDKDDPREKYRFKKNFVLDQYNYRTKIRAKMLSQLTDLFKPKLSFR